MYVFPDGSVETELSDEGDTVADMLEYVQLDPSALLAQIPRSGQRNRSGQRAAGAVLEEFEAGLYGYTYLEDE